MHYVFHPTSPHEAEGTSGVGITETDGVASWEYSAAAAGSGYVEAATGGGSDSFYHRKFMHLACIDIGGGSFDDKYQMTGRFRDCEAMVTNIYKITPLQDFDIIPVDMRSGVSSINWIALDISPPVIGYTWNNPTPNASRNDWYGIGSGGPGVANDYRLSVGHGTCATPGTPGSGDEGAALIATKSTGYNAGIVGAMIRFDYEYE